MVNRAARRRRAVARMPGSPQSEQWASRSCIAMRRSARDGSTAAVRSGPRPAVPSGAVELNFGSSAPFSLGVEEEFQLLNSETYDLTSRFDEVLTAAGGDPRIKAELLQSTAEVATDVARDVGEAIEHARELRHRVRDAAAANSVAVASAGTHPFARYEHQDVTEDDRYRDLAESLQWVVDRQLIFGLHVHVGMASAEQAIQVGNALRTWLPELLALSANSPFWHGRDTGLGSARS